MQALSSSRWRQSTPIDSNETVPFYQRYLGGGPGPRHRGFGFPQGGRSHDRAFSTREDLSEQIADDGFVFNDENFFQRHGK